MFNFYSILSECWYQYNKTFNQITWGYKCYCTLGFIVIGNEAANNLVFDNNEIPARNTGFDTAPEYVGVLAQELKAAGPYMVTTTNTKTGNANEGYLQVDNGAMTYMVINVVKEQQNHDYRAGKKMCRFIIAK